MEMVAPAGPVYQAGTLSGNPLATAAGNAQLAWLEKHDPFAELEARANRVVEAVADAFGSVGVPTASAVVGSMFGFFLQEGPVTSFDDALRSDTKRFSRFHRRALEQGVFFAPSPFEAGFVSTAHGEEEIGATAEAVLRAVHDG
jgi:glutamate-1-semialdehyde 2,1-aminomutase